MTLNYKLFSIVPVCMGFGLRRIHLAWRAVCRGSRRRYWPLLLHPQRSIILGIAGSEFNAISNLIVG